MALALDRALRDRLPLAMMLGAVLFATAAAVDPAFQRFPFVRPQGWGSALLVCLELGYLTAAAAAGLIAAARAVSLREHVAGSDENTPVEAAAPDAAWSKAGLLRIGGLSVRREAAVAAFLALVVVLETVLHVGPRSGSWVTSIPSEESDLTRADGHALWLEGQPIQEDATRFITDVDVFAGGPGLQFPPRFPYNVVQSTRATYSYLVALLARGTGALGSVYLAFVLVNVGLWWGAALAAYDLARHARRSAWAGIAAGLLTATGLGFTFMVGNPMSNAASYAGLVLVPWLLWRMGFARNETPLSSDLLAASIAACAGLLYGMSPVYLLFAALFYVGRRPLWRLIYWAIAVLAVGVCWETVNAWERAPFRVVSPPSLREWLLALALAGVVAAPPLIGRRPAWYLGVAGGRRPRWGRATLRQTIVGASIVGALLCGACLAVPASRAKLVTNAPMVVAAFQLPGQELEGHFSHLSLSSTSGGSLALYLVESARAAGLDTDTLGAFPGVIGIVALFGLFGLPRLWREWCVALLCATTLVAFVLIVVSQVSHPRLVYWAFPGVYLLTASGLLNGFHLTNRLLSARGTLPAWLTRTAACVVAMSLLAAVMYPAHASLFGNWAYESRFHFGGF